MKEKVQTLLSLLFPNGNYVSPEEDEEKNYFVGYSNVFQLTRKDTLYSWSHIVEVVNLEDEEIIINVLPTFADQEWNNENKDVLKGALGAIIYMLFPIEEWHKVKYDEKGLFVSAYIKTNKD